MDPTVLIAPPDHLTTLKQQQDFEGALTFSDADALPALEAITRQRPRVVAVERLFASTPRGAALINRIRADPSLQSCEIRIVTSDIARERPVAARAEEVHAATIVATPAPVVTEAAVATLDPRGTRRTPRFRMPPGLQVLLDGTASALIDLSMGGAQVVCPNVLRPGQRVRLRFTDPTKPLRITAVVAWTAFEMPAGQPRYRAGLQFVDRAPDALQDFIDRNERT